MTIRCHCFSVNDDFDIESPAAGQCAGAPRLLGRSFLPEERPRGSGGGRAGTGWHISEGCRSFEGKRFNRKRHLNWPVAGLDRKSETDGVVDS